MYQNMNSLVFPKDKSYKEELLIAYECSSWAYTHSPQGWALILVYSMSFMSRKRREEHGLDSRCASNEGKISTNGSFVRVMILQAFPQHNLALRLSSFLICLSPMASFYRLISSHFQTHLPCERERVSLNGDVSSSMDGQTSYLGEGLEVWRTSSEISKSLYP